MAALLVAYDLKKPGQNYTKFLETIKSYAWARLSESSYAIATWETADAVYAKLKPYIDSNDQIYVIRLGQNWQGFGATVVNDWLNQNL